MSNLDDTMGSEVVVKKWGNSLAVVVPNDIAKEKNLKENDKIFIEIVKPADLRKIFGTLKRKMSGQEFKNLVREGWK